MCKSGYKVSIDKVLGHLSKSGRVKDDHIRSLFFCDFMHAEHIYDEITDLHELHKKMEQYAVMFWKKNSILLIACYVLKFFNVARKNI